MPVLRVAIADSNSDYLNRLTVVLSEYSNLQISQFDDQESLVKMVSNGKCKVLLLDSSMYDFNLQLDKVQVVIMLTDGKKIPDACARYRKISKYQRIDYIYRQILEICSESLENSGSDNGGAASVISFYSPLGGCGKTSVALITAIKMALIGKKVLYLNLEPFPSDAFFLPQTGESSLSTLLEHLSRSGDHTMYMQSCLQTKSDNLSYICHFESPNDYGAISTDELESLMDVCCHSGSFDYVLVDTAGGFDKKIQCVLGLSNQVVLVERNDAISTEKLNSFIGQRYLMEEYGEKMKRVLNFDNGRGSMLQTSIPLIGQLRSVGNIDCTSLIMAKVESAESNYVQKLVE
ncbi:MAG: hypothetical protein IKY52_08580 [Clostridia bacterium]|nr:hypothetical protein [Clostridia bacterium]